MFIVYSSEDRAKRVQKQISEIASNSNCQAVPMVDFFILFGETNEVYLSTVNLHIPLQNLLPVFIATLTDLFIQLKSINTVEFYFRSSLHK